MLLKLDKNGFFSAILLIVFSTLLIATIASYRNELVILREAHITTIEMERASFERFQIEENLSKIIKETLESELSKNNTDSFLLNSVVNKKIANAYERFKKHFGCELYITDGINNYRFSGLSDLSRTIVVESSGLKIAEYTYTGGAMKNKRVVCKIRKGKAYVFASLVPGYTIRATKVG
ncbi:MAG: hypothetical protein N3F05_02325 [Candidatus Diapherotrites archaeon]|nr:hypothetical protein [Candidatus Diapherotrites archaeon]